MINESRSLLGFLMFIYAVMWSLHVDYIISTVGHTCARHICSRTHPNNVKCMHTSIPNCIVDCSEFSDTG